jgi:2-keto-4-pentenoate hydratase/2-oxohepta-3-ene-1,7-dioic acid hydratase in catechol pathway
MSSSSVASSQVAGGPEGAGQRYSSMVGDGARGSYPGWTPWGPPPPAVFCIGLNYKRHAAETGLPEPRYPVVRIPAG